MRRYGRVDNNQKNIVKTLKSAGFSVQTLADVGSGVPDIAFACGGRNFLAEIKNSEMPPSKQALTPDQVIFHAKWRGEIFILHSVAETLVLIDKIKVKLAKGG